MIDLIGMYSMLYIDYWLWEYSISFVEGLLWEWLFNLRCSSLYHVIYKVFLLHISIIILTHEQFKRVCVWGGGGGGGD